MHFIRQKQRLPNICSAPYGVTELMIQILLNTIDDTDTLYSMKNVCCEDHKSKIESWTYQYSLSVLFILSTLFHFNHLKTFFTHWQASQFLWNVCTLIPYLNLSYLGRYKKSNDNSLSCLLCSYWSLPFSDFKRLSFPLLYLCLALKSSGLDP